MAAALPVKEFWKSVEIWQNYGHELGVQFLAHHIQSLRAVLAFYLGQL